MCCVGLGKPQVVCAANKALVNKQRILKLPMSGATAVLEMKMCEGVVVVVGLVSQAS